MPTLVDYLYKISNASRASVRRQLVHPSLTKTEFQRGPAATESIAVVGVHDQLLNDIRSNQSIALNRTLAQSY
jgi:hypothetical protein